MAHTRNEGTILEKPNAGHPLIIENVSLPGTARGSKWDVRIVDGTVESITERRGPVEEAHHTVRGHGALLAPSLCHAHIHLDKSFLLSHPKYSHLQIQQGDFPEAMALTGKAKALFEMDDLLERGQRVVDESVTAGVTHMRAFVEVDAGVRNTCLEAGSILQRRAANEGRCTIQLCAFAQLPLFSPSQDDEDGAVIRGLLREATSRKDVDTVGSTPYVETDLQRMERNVSWMVDLSIEFNLHLDFHLDYNLDEQKEPLVWFVIQKLRETDWKSRTSDKTVVLGHCTRLTLFDSATWRKLAAEIKEAGLPVSFVGLPNSDMFMMRTGRQPEIRGTLDIPRLIEDFGLNACISTNNIGNAFTPQGSCDPLTLACQGVGIYQAGTETDAEVLYEGVSTRAKAAIGFGSPVGDDTQLELRPGDVADFVLFGSSEFTWRTRTTISEVVRLHDSGLGRRLCRSGRVTGNR